jgi:hypothetical protein
MVEMISEVWRKPDTRKLVNGVIEKTARVTRQLLTIDCAPSLL